MVPLRTCLGSFAILCCLLAAGARAQTYQGTIGLYDDSTMTQPHGTMDPGLKTIWIGFRREPGSWFFGYTGFEFSVAGIEPPLYLLQVEFFPPPNIILGDVRAPVDTVHGTGGINVVWPYCLEDDGVFGKLTLVSPAPPENHVLAVRRRYPPSHPLFPWPIFAPCAAPCFCIGRAREGQYVMNPVVAITGRTWGAVKALYREW